MLDKCLIIGFGLIIYLIFKFGFNVFDKLFMYNICLFLFIVLIGYGGILFIYNL